MDEEIRKAVKEYILKVLNNPNDYGPQDIAVVPLLLKAMIELQRHSGTGNDVNPTEVQSKNQ